MRGDYKTSGDAQAPVTLARIDNPLADLPATLEKPPIGDVKRAEEQLTVS